MELGLKGKRALVTGSSSGIGIGIAKMLAAEGVSVVVHGRDATRAQGTAKQIEEGGGIAAVAIGDLSTDAGAKSVAEAALAAFGGVDILVNNAGGRAGTGDNSSWLAVDSNDWAATYQANVISAVRMIRHLAPKMIERGWGRIIQIASTLGASPIPTEPDYCASKVAMYTLTLGLSKALSNTGVTVNAISPGMIYTPGLELFLNDVASRMGFGSDRAKTEAFVLKEFVPQTVSRMGQPEDVGAIVLYLASPIADFVNGANWRVDGGMSRSIS